MSASVAYVALFIIAKLLGKKQIAELDFIDYVTGISIGSIAAEMACNNDRPLYFYLIGMGVFFVFDLLVTLLGRKANWLKAFLRGRPIILINKGKMDFKALKKCKIDIYDLLGLARDKGYFSLDEIEFAVFETNGDLSILAKDANRQVKRQDFCEIPPKKVDMTYYMIVDREISFFALSATGKSNAWVKKQLEDQNLKLKQIMLASYDQQSDKLKILTY